MFAAISAGVGYKSSDRMSLRGFTQHSHDQAWPLARSITYIASYSKRSVKAKTWKIVRDNVAETVKPPPVPDQELPILQPDRAREMLQALRGKPLHLLASLALATGMRRNEMLALRWQNVDLDASRLRVEQALEETQAYGIRTKRRLRPGTAGARLHCRLRLLLNYEPIGRRSRSNASRLGSAKHQTAPLCSPSSTAGS
jgi:integrase